MRSRRARRALVGAGTLSSVGVGVVAIAVGRTSLSGDTVVIVVAIVTFGLAVVVIVMVGAGLYVVANQARTRRLCVLILAVQGHHPAGRPAITAGAASRAPPHLKAVPRSRGRRAGGTEGPDPGAGERRAGGASGPGGGTESSDRGSGNRGSAGRRVGDGGGVHPGVHPCPRRDARMRTGAGTSAG